jgi:hypothetical protein
MKAIKIHRRLILQTIEHRKIPLKTASEMPINPALLTILVYLLGMPTKRDNLKRGKRLLHKIMHL